jgi:hypothetical protein
MLNFIYGLVVAPRLGKKDTIEFRRPNLQPLGANVSAFIK